MMRDNLVGLIEPMVYRAGVHSLAGHHQARQTGGCSRSTELAIVALKRSWRQIFRWKTGRRAENSNWPAWEMTTAAHASRAVGTACHQSHRTIDPQCLTKSPPRRGGIFALTKNVASPVHAEPAHLRAAGTACARAQVDMLRERLLRLGARVLVSVRRWVIHLPTSFPFLPAFRLIACRLGAQSG